ncbi:MAG TPA: ribosome-binding factor A [Candidatus Saccharimonadales bacterium]|nr:ribosome-binding factor A [Candidatus Saccharimonadales bacterium]
MNRTNLSQIKRSQKESLLLREISKMLHQLSLEDTALAGLFVNRVELSKNKGMCFIYFYDPNGIEAFQEKNKRLVLYKPSLRKGIASALDARYTPELKFAFDEKFDKQQRIENIIEQVKKDFKKNSTQE